MMRPFQYATLLFVLGIIGWFFGFIYTGIGWWLLVVLVVLYIHLLVLGAVKIRWNFFVNSLNSQPGKTKEIALTFDDGPAGMTSLILDALKENDVKAAFFSIGKNARANPLMVARWDDEGHLIGNHSYEHGFNFDWKSTNAMQAELVETNDVVAEIIHKRPKLFRAPYGVTNPNLAKAIRRTGMHSIGWNIRSFDTTAKDADQLLNRILKQIKGGDIILLHDSMDITYQILTPLIKAAKQKGFTFVRVDQLLGIEGYE